MKSLFQVKKISLYFLFNIIFFSLIFIILFYFFDMVWQFNGIKFIINRGIGIHLYAQKSNNNDNNNNNNNNNKIFNIIIANFYLFKHVIDNVFEYFMF